MSSRIGMIAGEPSSDFLASQLIKVILKRQTDSRCMGIGGPRMESMGFESFYSMNALSTFGYIDSIKRLPYLLHIYNNLKKYWLKKPPSLFIGIDAPDFNLPLEKQIKRLGVPTFHFVSPSIWAWRYDRIQKIKESVSHIFVLFPFEERIYIQEEIPVSYVGHPLANLIPIKPDQEKSRELLSLDKNVRTLAILPGSRSSEIKLLSPPFLKAAQLLSQMDPDLQFIVPMANEIRSIEFEKILKKIPVPRLKIFTQKYFEKNQHDIKNQPISWTVIQASNAVLTASGTATLEAALYKKPMVISYILSPWMHRFMAWKSNQKHPYMPWIGLPNILAKDFIVPELLQSDATPENIASNSWEMLTNEIKRKKIQKNFLSIHNQLSLDTANLIADKILNI